MTNITKPYNGAEYLADDDELRGEIIQDMLKQKDPELTSLLMRDIVNSYILEKNTRTDNKTTALLKEVRGMLQVASFKEDHARTIEGHLRAIKAIDEHLKELTNDE